MGGVQPRLTERSVVDPTYLVTVDQAREIAGIYEDDSYEDKVILAKLRAATDYAARLAGRPLIKCDCVDRYAGWNRRMALSARQYNEEPLTDSSVTALSLKHYDGSDQIQTVDAGDYVLDLTDESVALHVKSHDVLELALSEYRANPVFVEYTFDPLAVGGAELAAEAIGLLFKAIFDIGTAGGDATTLPMVTRQTAITLMRPITELVV